MFFRITQARRSGPGESRRDLHPVPLCKMYVCFTKAKRCGVNSLAPMRFIAVPPDKEDPMNLEQRQIADALIDTSVRTDTDAMVADMTTRRFMGSRISPPVT